MSDELKRRAAIAKASAQVAGGIVVKRERGVSDELTEQEREAMEEAIRRAPDEVERHHELPLDEESRDHVEDGARFGWLARRAYDATLASSEAQPPTRWGDRLLGTADCIHGVRLYRSCAQCADLPERCPAKRSGDGRQCVRPEGHPGDCSATWGSTTADFGYGDEVEAQPQGDGLSVQRVPVESISEGDRVIAGDRLLTVTKTGKFAPDVLLVELAHAQLRRKPGDFMFRVLSPPSAPSPAEVEAAAEALRGIYPNEFADDGYFQRQAAGILTAARAATREES